MDLSGISCVNVSHRYDGAITNSLEISLEISPGEIVALVGPSGCGKSTLLRLLAGLEQPRSGVIRVDRKSLGVVFQDSSLLPWRSVRDNVALPGELAGTPRAIRDEVVVGAISRVGLSGHELKYPHQLSGGMKMRTAVARALSTGASTFLFDEPFASLDELTREELNDDLLRIHSDTPFTALFVTHSISEAAYLAHRVLVMSSTPGHIIADIKVDSAHPRAGSDRFGHALLHAEREIHRALRAGI